MDIISTAGGAGSFSFDDSPSRALPSTGRGRVRSADFGLPERTGLLDLAHIFRDPGPALAGTGWHRRRAGGRCRHDRDARR